VKEENKQEKREKENEVERGRDEKTARKNNFP